MGLLCAIIYKQWVLNTGSLVYFINNIIIFVQLNNNSNSKKFTREFSISNINNLIYKK